MKTPTADRLNGTTTRCLCVKVTLTNGTVLGFTSLDRNLTLGGVLYEVSSAFTGSAIKQQTRLAVDNMDVMGVLDSDTVDAADLRAGVWDFAAIDVLSVDYLNTSDVITLNRGRLGEVSHERNTYRAEFRGLANAYSQQILEVCQPGCRATLGDTRCGVSLAAYTVTGTLTGVSTDGLVLLDTARTEPGPSGGKAISGITKSAEDGFVTTIAATAHGFSAGQVVYLSAIGGMVQLNGRHYQIKTAATNSFTIHENSFAYDAYTSGGTATPQGDAGYFAYGKVTMTSGASSGLSMEVKAYAPGAITLQLQMPLGAAAGDTYSLHAGCGGRFDLDCVARFANGARFRGEPHIPGMDQIMRAGGQ